MSHQPFVSAISKVVRGDLQEALPIVEVAAGQHPGWVTPIVAMAVAAEQVEDWEAAFELWSQARILLPDSRKIGNGVRRASLKLLKQATPERHSSRRVERADSYDSQETSHSTDETHKAGTETAPVTETSSPTPLVTPLDFDLTEFATQTSFETPAEPAASAASDAATTFDELDDLIGRLQGARIVPRHDADAIPTPDLEADIEDVASETLAAIYLGQQQFSEAARVYEKLADQQPERADEFLTKAHEARARVTD